LVADGAEEGAMAGEAASRYTARGARPLEANDQNPMGIAAEIIEHLLGSAERSLGVDEERENLSLQRKGRGPSGANRLTIREAW
jgi:hypothetical protein